MKFNILYWTLRGGFLFISVIVWHWNSWVGIINYNNINWWQFLYRSEDNTEHHLPLNIGFNGIEAFIIRLFVEMSTELVPISIIIKFTKSFFAGISVCCNAIKSISSLTDTIYLYITYITSIPLNIIHTTKYHQHHSQILQKLPHWKFPFAPKFSILFQ